MNNAIAFDVYGTLIDTQAVSGRLSELIGDKVRQSRVPGGKSNSNTASGAG
ncbi:hypothetical protein [Pseudomonas putida]|jgi:FMN phosphatase YigB (HAD superfamily)|uniref:hypothetical protein n=1 Tax=Pseudomonas putida TaxID=303 RepID=UPI00192E47E8|nr:hypothetical protein [Pseudomonas putida]